MKKDKLLDSDRNLLSQYGLVGLDLKDADRLLFEQGEYNFWEGEPIEYIYFVVSGKAKVCANTSDGKRLLLAYYVAGEIFGDVELMSGRRATVATMQAISDFACIGLPLFVYAEELLSNLAFVHCLGSGLAEKMRKNTINGAITALQPLEARLCAYILQMSDAGMFRETLMETAELLGVSYRHLLRCLDKLQKDGILRKETCCYRVMNQQMLRKKAVDLYTL